MAKDFEARHEGRKIPHVREAIDAESHEGLKADPTDDDAKLDVALDESFPTSDAPSPTRPGSGEPAPSSGYDETAERWMARKSAWRAVARSWAVPALAVAVLVGAAVAIASTRRAGRPVL